MTMTIALLLLNSLLGLVLAGMLLRADHTRHENQMLALACMLDAAVAGGISLLVAFGSDVAGPASFRLCLLARILIVHPTLEFTYAFPFERRPPRLVRWLGLTATACALLLLLWPRTSSWFERWSSLVFFVPYFTVTVGVLLGTVHTMRARGDARGAIAILAALTLRWGVELLTYLVVRPLFPQAFPSAFLLDCTATVFIGYMAITSAVLQHRFFRVSGLVAQALLYGSLVLSALAVVAIGIDVTLQRIHAPLAQRVALLLIALLPLGAWILIRRYAPRLEETILHRLDPRGAVRKFALESVLRETATLVDATVMCRLTSQALATLSGGSAHFYRCATPGGDDNRGLGAEPQLPERLAAQLATTKALCLRRFAATGVPDAEGAFLAEIGARLVVPVRFEQVLFGALAVTGGEIDQDTVSGAVALADNLAGKLAHHALYHRAFDLKRQLEESHRLAELGAFAAAIAHDIRTPLTSVQMNVQMLRSQRNLSADDLECADIALDELKRMARYVSEILDYSKPVQLRSLELDVQQLLEETVRGMQIRLESRMLRLACTAPPRPLPPLRADAARVRQLLENLVDNAANASTSGARISLCARPFDDRHLAIEVADSGCGISEKDVDRVFEPFFTTRPDGTGLGLAIVKKLVKAHHGEITVRSQPGVGSTFTVVLPI